MLNNVHLHVEADILRGHVAGGLAFAVGDRIQARDHQRIDDEGGYGVVVEIGVWQVSRFRLHDSVRVVFDSMPDHKFWCNASDLQYDRRERVAHDRH